MKKKEIEKIPFRGGVRADKQYRNTAVAFFQDIRGESHLFVEVYENKKRELQTPWIRMVFTQKDWGLYYPDAGVWSAAGLDEEREKIGSNCEKRDNKCYMARSQGDMVWKFTGDTWERKYTTWVGALQSLIYNIKAQRVQKREDKRADRLKEREQNTPPLPKGLEDWAKKTGIGTEHFLYYKRHGRYITEGAAEGVRGDVAFAQSCLETGNFTFSGSAVTLSQNNFCGLGVTKTGMRGDSFKMPAEGIRAQIQHLQAYASMDRLKNRCVDPRYTYVNRGCAEYVEHLGIQENPKGQGWASGRNYGQKIINILNSILSIKTSKTEKESTTMNINTSLISNNNSYAGQKPAYIVIHNTDNYAKGANAKAHAKAQHDGNFKGYSAHVYVDDTEAYQALPYNRGAWHVGVNYGGRLFGTVNNRNSVGIEMCVQAGYNYEKAFQNTVQVCKQLMKQLGIPADRVVQHYDVCAKNCPSAIRAKGDWNRFKQLIGAKTATPTVDKYYRTRKSWADSKSQIGAYKSLENAKKEWKQGYTIYDWNGKAVYPVQTSGKAVVLTGKFEAQLPIIRKGNSGVAVSVLQSVLGVTVDGRFGDDTETSLKVFQKNTGVKANGTCGIDSWKKVIEHVKANTK